MSEEEREILQGLDDMKHLEINPEYKVRIINGILDLYNKEKEKNVLLLANNNGYYDLKKYIKDNYISKDKIKEELNELDNMKVDGEVFTTAVNFAKKILQELLEGDK